jgi:hypothetical protein
MDIGRSGCSIGSFSIKKMGNDYDEIYSFFVDFILENSLSKIKQYRGKNGK